jgi:hypothetical protein
MVLGQLRGPSLSRTVLKTAPIQSFIFSHGGLEVNDFDCRLDVKKEIRMEVRGDAHAHTFARAQMCGALFPRVSQLVALPVLRHTSDKTGFEKVPADRTFFSS